MTGSEDMSGGARGRAKRAGAVRRVIMRAAVMAGVVVAIGMMGTPAHAAFTAGITGTTLHVNGDGSSGHLALRLQGSAPNILQVDVGDNGSADFAFNRNLFDHIVVDAGGGADVVRIDQTNGVFTDTEITTLGGGSGNDTLTGGSFAETFVGGSGTDFIDGNQADDLALMGTGADRFNWDPGDGNDTLEGQGGIDTMRFNGANIAETFDFTANGGRLRFTRNIASVVMDTDGVEKVQLNATGGADIVNVHDLTGTDVTGITTDLASPIGTATGDGSVDQIVVEGTSGADVANLAATSGVLTVSGLATSVSVTHAELANDVVTVNGLAGNDQASSTPLGPLPVKVTVDGGADTDTYRANGTDAADLLTVTANGTFAFVSGDNATGVNVLAENVELDGLGGPDTTFAVGNLAALTRLTFDGGKGSDILNGGNGPDTFLGGDGNDFIDGNQGDDLALMGTGTDTFNWDPGDGNDTVEGQDDVDTLRFNGANIGETFELTPNGGRLRFTRNIASVVMDTDGVEKVAINALGGTDIVRLHDLTGTDVTGVTTDLASTIGGASGDGSADQVVVDGTGGNDNVGVSAALGVLSVTGLTPAVSLAHAELANDLVTVNGLAGNDQVSSTPLGPLPVNVTVDGGADNDTYRADGTNAVDLLTVTANGTFAFVSGDNATGVNVLAENVVVNGLGGPDTTFAVGNLAALTRITFDGGKGSDVLNGGNGPDRFLGGDGNDFIDGNQGDDLALMGAGTDTFNWDPGDGNDTVEGQDAVDTLRFNGANIGETFEASANGGRLRFTRNIGTVTMDTDDVEKILVNALGGADIVRVHDLTGTDVTGVTTDLASTIGGASGDGAADQVVVEGTGGVDAITVAGNTANGVTVSGLVATVKILTPEFANDRLDVNTMAGADTVSSGGLAPNTIQLFVDGVPQ